MLSIVNRFFHRVLWRNHCDSRATNSNLHRYILEIVSLPELTSPPDAIGNMGSKLWHSLKILSAVMTCKWLTK